MRWERSGRAVILLIGFGGRREAGLQGQSASETAREEHAKDLDFF